MLWNWSFFHYKEILRFEKKSSVAWSLKDKGRAMLWECHAYFSRAILRLGHFTTYRISANSFCGKLFFFEFGLMYCDLWSQYIKVRKLFKGINYLRKYGSSLLWAMKLWDTLYANSQDLINLIYLTFYWNDESNLEKNIIIFLQKKLWKSDWHRPINYCWRSLKTIRIDSVYAQLLGS